jgi:hypothetical protein
MFYRSWQISPNLPASSVFCWQILHFLPAQAIVAKKSCQKSLQTTEKATGLLGKICRFSA